MENKDNHVTGILGTASAVASYAFHWAAAHLEGATHIASIVGTWVGAAVAVISLFRLLRNKNEK